MKIADVAVVAALGLCVPLFAPEALASVYYNSFGKFTVDVLDASTIFNSSCTFNGNTVRLFDQVVDGDRADSTGTLLAVLTADPGYVFSETFLNFGQTGWSNTSFGPAGYTHTGSWSVPGSVYQGDGSFRGGFGGQESNWDVYGDNGTFYYRNIFAGSGGSVIWRDVMDRSGRLLLLNAQSFVVMLGSDIHQFSVASYSGYSTSFEINPTTIAAPVPEPSFAALVLACVGTGWALRRRCRAA